MQFKNAPMILDIPHGMFNRYKRRHPKAHEVRRSLKTECEVRLPNMPNPAREYHVNRSTNVFGGEGKMSWQKNDETGIYPQIRNSINETIQENSRSRAKSKLNKYDSSKRAISEIMQYNLWLENQKKLKLKVDDSQEM